MLLMDSAFYPRLFAMSAACLAVSVVVSAFEYITLLGEFRRGGAFCWRFVETEIQGTTSGLYRVKRTLLGYRTIAVILAARAIFGGSLLLPYGAGRTAHHLLPAFLGCLLATGAFLHWRCTFGLEGGDLMSMIVCAGLLVAALPGPHETWFLMGFGFIAAESCLSYFTSGVAKLASPSWRNGEALYGILRTGTFGHRAMAELVHNRTVVSQGICWGVIAFEVTFPLLLLLPSRIMMAGLAIGAVFHIANAFVMGLNTFCWAFLATYPGIFYCNSRIHALLR